MSKLTVLKCPDRFKKQCLSVHCSYGCKLRFFNQRCFYALSLKNKEVKEVKNESYSIKERD